MAEVKPGGGGIPAPDFIRVSGGLSGWVVRPFFMGPSPAQRYLAFGVAG